MTIAVYAGSFDPITNGHLDVATRAAKLFHKLIIGVYETPANKRILFTTEERVAMAKRATAYVPNIEVLAFTGMIVDFAKKVDADTMVRGLRMSADFEREFEMALMNKKMAPNLELVCLMTNLKYQFLSSSLLKEIASLNGDIDSFVPAYVAEALKQKLVTNNYKYLKRVAYGRVRFARDKSNDGSGNCNRYFSENSKINKGSKRSFSFSIAFIKKYHCRVSIVIPFDNMA